MTRLRTKRYLVYPRYIVSKNDGQRHFISARQLIRLYGVDPAECVIFQGEHTLLGTNETPIPLRPSYSGDYSLPTECP